jgi:hypothetical protein
LIAVLAQPDNASTAAPNSATPANRLFMVVS